MRLKDATRSAAKLTAREAAALVRPGMWVDYGVSHGQPDVFDFALAARVGELTDVKIRSCLSVAPRAVLEADSEGNRFRLFSWHFSGYDRGKHDEGRCNYVPLNLGEVPDYYRRFIDPIDIAILKVRPMDESGRFNFGTSNVWQRAIVESAKTVIVEVTTGLPHVYGDENAVHIDEVDYIIARPNP